MSVKKGAIDVMQRVEVGSKEAEVGVRSGGSSGRKKNSLQSATVTPMDASDDQVERMVSDGPSTPVDDQNDPEEENEGELSEEEEDELQEAFDYLFELKRDGKLSAVEVDDLIEWAEDEIDHGQSVDYVVGYLKRQKKRAQIFSLPRFVGRKREPQIPLCYTRTADRQEQREAAKERDREELQQQQRLQNMTPMSEATTSSSSSSPPEDPWDYFRDEYASDKKLDEVSVEIWNAEMEVKIKQAENVIKELTSQAASKKEKVLKFRAGDVFEKYVRDLKAEIMNVPFCAKRFDYGSLINPREIPNPKSAIYYQEIGGNEVFNPKVYGKALMLWTLLEDIKAKTSGFLYAVITYSMQENVAAQEVIRADTSRDFFILFKRLKERFQINTDIAKEKCVQNFYEMARKPTEPLREFWGRLMTMVCELRTVYKRDVLDEDIKRLFFKELPDAGKNNFLQLVGVDLYKHNLNDLCLEIIRRQEELDSSTAVKTDVLNNVNDRSRPDNRQCYECGKLGHIQHYCPVRKANDNNSLKKNIKHNPFLKNGRNDKRNKFMKNKQDKRNNKFKGNRSHGKANNSGQDKANNTAGNVNVNKSVGFADECILECHFCHQRNGHTSADCPNTDVRIRHLNNKYKSFEAENNKYDSKHPDAKIRVLMVTIVNEHDDSDDGSSPITYHRGEEADYFTIKN